MLDAESLSTLYGHTITDEQAWAAVSVVTALAKSYVRYHGPADTGRGFDASGRPLDDVEAVLMTAALRLLTNPTGVAREDMGALTVQYGNNFLGWSLTELSVLNRYRDRAS